MGLQEELNLVLNQTIAFHKEFVDIGGSTNAGLMLSQAYYWSDRTKDPNGWFYKTKKEWEEETGLSRYEQENARKKLVNEGLLEETRRGIPAKMYFKVDKEAILAAIKQLQNTPDKEVTLTASQPEETTDTEVILTAEQTFSPQSGMRESIKQECEKLASKNEENHQSNTEITTEITSNTTTTAESSSKNFLKKEKETKLLFDHNLENTTEDYRQKMLLIMKDVPETEQQKLLDELNSALSKPGRVNNALLYLRGIVKNYEKGKFNPTSRLPEQRLKKQRQEGKICAERQNAREMMQNRAEMPAEIRALLGARRPSSGKNNNSGPSCYGTASEHTEIAVKYVVFKHTALPTKQRC